MCINRILSFKARLLAGFALNMVLLSYVYFGVEGGPVSIQQGGGWEAILNELPQTILIFMVAVLMPYIMVWSRCKKNTAVISLASTVMLASTVISCVLIVLAHKPVIKELTLDLSWVILWGTSVYFVLMPQRFSQEE